MLYKQKMSKALGEEGCYFLCLIFIAEQVLGKDIDALWLFDEAQRKGWAEADCYMTNPAAMMTSLLGKICTIRKSTDFSEPLMWNEWEIRNYKREATGATYYHFVVMKGDAVLYDPLEESVTVAEGSPSSRRILTISA